MLFGINQGLIPWEQSSRKTRLGAPAWRRSREPLQAASCHCPLPTARCSHGKGSVFYGNQGVLGICRKLKDPPSDRDFGGLLLDFFNVLSHCRNLDAAYQSIGNQSINHIPIIPHQSQVQCKLLCKAWSGQRVRAKFPL